MIRNAVIRRRTLLGGLMSFGGIPPRRPDQHIAPPRPGMLPGPLSNIVQAIKVVTGQPPNSQVIIDSTLNYSVITTMPFTGAAADDITSISHITSAVRFPSNNASEVSPPLIANIIITWSSGAHSDGLLSLGGIFAATGVGYFTLDVSFSDTDASKSGGQIVGMYTISGSTINLFPRYVLDRNQDIITYQSVITPAIQSGPTTGHLIPGPEAFRDLGSTGLAGDGGTASFRITSENEVQLTIHKSWTALGAITSASFATALPGAYIPPANRLTSGDPVSVNGAAPGAGTRLTITAATGVVNLVNLPAGSTGAGCDVRIPLI